MKRILIFNSGGFVYGAEKGLTNLVKAIKGKSIITVVLPKRGLLARKLKSISANIRIKIFPLPILTASFSPVYLIKTALLFILNLIYFPFYVIFKKTDIICTNSLLLFSPGIIAKITNKEHIWFVREFFASGLINRIFGFFVKFFSNKIICQSEAISSKLHLKNGANIVYEPLNPDDYKIYPNELARKEFDFSVSAKIITIISRIHPLKGQYEFIKDFQDTLANDKDLFLLIVGDISSSIAKNRLYKRKIEEIIKKNNLKNVCLLGYRSDIDKILSLSDICVFPFRREEPFGIAVTEALAFGKKVFYPRSGGLKEVYKIFGSGEDLTAEGILKELSRLKRGRFSGTGKLYVPDILLFEVYKDKIVDIIGQ